MWRVNHKLSYLITKLHASGEEPISQSHIQYRQSTPLGAVGTDTYLHGARRRGRKVPTRLMHRYEVRNDAGCGGKSAGSA